MELVQEYESKKPEMVIYLEDLKQSTFKEKYLKVIAFIITNR